MSAGSIKAVRRVHMRPGEPDKIEIGFYLEKGKRTMYETCELSLAEAHTLAHQLADAVDERPHA